MNYACRTDFGGIDNEALDFSQLEDYINDDNGTTSVYFQDALVGSDLKSSVVSTKSTTNNRPVLEIASSNPKSLPNSGQVPSANPSTKLLLQYHLPVNGQPLKAVRVASISLPESPPDSGSEPSFSPRNEENHVALSSTSETMMHSPGESLKHFMLYNNTQPLKHLPETSLTITPNHQLSPSSQVSLSSTPTVLTHLQPQQSPQLTSPLTLPQPPQTLGPSSIYESSDDFLCDALDSSNGGHKKRKLSDTPKNVPNNLLNGILSVKQENDGLNHADTNATALSATDDEYSFDFSGPDGSNMFLDSAYQCIRFQAFQQNTWSVVCDKNFKELPPPNYRVDADKGFNFSNADDAFVCQKKNHFQVTVHIQPFGEPHFIKAPDGFKKIDHFYLHFNGVKVESPSQTIKVEQSQSDRSKKPFHPVILALSPDQVSKKTVGRLHFSETTSNNMRKKGKPNPDQRYFYLVVSLCAATSDLGYTMIAHSSERIIVRASNPGQFENDMELSWQRGHTTDSIYHAGRVGVNTDRPDEALVVHGNVKVTGHIVQPSDIRAKTNIEEVDTREQLKNVANMRIVRYHYSQDFAQHMGLTVESPPDTGVIAQEVQNIIPEAVSGAGDIVLPNGQHIENFLVVNKERIFMENVGAVKELCKVTDNLEIRIDELEKVNKKLSKVKRMNSIKSTTSGSTTSQASTHVSHVNPKQHKPCHRHTLFDGSQQFCSNYIVQCTIVLLVLIMAFCLIAMASLYILEWQRRHQTLSFVDTEDFQNKIIPNNRTGMEKRLQDSYFLENEKYQSVNENSIAAQNSNKKENNRSSFPRPWQVSNPESSTMSMSSTLSTLDGSMPSRLSRLSTPTSIPVLKPRLIGSPLTCRDSYSQFPMCDVHCCAMATGQRRTLYDTNEDDFRRTSGRSASYQSNSDHEANASDLTTVSAAESQMTEMPGGDEEHQPRFNQIKPDVEPSPALLWSKITSDKNSTSQEFEKSENYKSPSSSSFFHKMSLLRSDKSSLLWTTPETHDRSVRDLAQSPKMYSRKDLAKVIESLKLLELNASIGQQYCNTLQCVQGWGPRFSYHIPISKYMVEEYVTLQFNLVSPMLVDHCEPDEKPLACPVPHDGAANLPHGYIREQYLTEEMDSSWRLPIGLFLRSAYRFRVQARSVDSDTPCSLPMSELGYGFIEFLFVFQRKCDK